MGSFRSTTFNSILRSFSVDYSTHKSGKDEFENESRMARQYKGETPIGGQEVI